MGMYRPLNPPDANGPAGLLTGVQAVRDYVGQFTATTGPDGLTFVAPEGASIQDVGISERLRDWLIGLRLLRNVPLSYLVPDARLLPPESIRFFFVDPNWVDRVVDGVFSAATTGTIASHFHVGMLQLVRQELDKTLTELADVPGWGAGAAPMTGMLIRSELVRRWPDVLVAAFAGTGAQAAAVPVLRAEPVSRDVFIALFAGAPKVVHLREPHVGVRFGVEPANPEASEPPYQVDRRLPNGQSAPGAPVPVPLRGGAGGDRVVDVAGLGAAVALHLGASQPGVADDYKGSRFVALHLQQRPYVQVFTLAVPEEPGSVPLPTGVGGRYQTTTALRKHRVMRMDSLIARQTQQSALQGDSD